MIKIAYLNTQYPSLSHTFIEREVRCVRARGVDVETFSIRRPDASGRMGDAHARAAKETSYVLYSTGALLASFVLGALRSPMGVARALWQSQQLAPAGVWARLLHVAYAMEAVRLAQMLSSRGITHVHVHMANSGAMVALLACVYRRRLRYSLTIHGSAEFFDVHRLRLGEKARRAVFVRCISRFCRAQVMMSAPPASWSRFHIVPTGVDPRHFVPPHSRPQDQLRLVAVGRMVAVKGYDLLLTACAALESSGTPWSLMMVGDGPSLPDLRARARELSIDHRVTFAGAVSQDDLRELLADANAMVVSSFMEGVPVVLMEAMAMELAVVATRVGGIPELVEHGRDGLIVDAGDPSPLAEALQQLADDPALRATLGTAARHRVIAQYDVENAGAAMCELFQRYVADRGAEAEAEA